ncbi:MAG TPA: tail protein X [Thermoanaerobaculia bacterium]|jgi:hypothetical protein|nr:tail protein X [Thermoanaerobaculia bacterium]
MNITTINDKESLDELIDRVQGPGASKNADVRAAFLKLNPHLADFAQLPAGTPVVLPSNSTAAPVPDVRTQNAIAQTQQAVTVIRGDLDAGTARSKANADATTALLNDPKVVDAVHARSGAEPARAGVLQAVADEQKQWNDTQAEIAGALTGFEETLKNWNVPPPGGGDGPTPPPDAPPVGRRRAVGSQ